MRATGWSAAAVEFFAGLEADNTKAYWQAHQDVYVKDVRQPMEALLAELAPEFGAGKIFRPYRDVRFSADKTPYKTAIGATLERGGYVQFSADGVGAGYGMYHLSPDQLERYRRAVADERTGAALSRIVAEARDAGLSVSGRDALKTAPRGYPKDSPRIELLRYKGLITWQEWPPEESAELQVVTGRVVAFFRASRPLDDWLNEQVGPAEIPTGRGR